MKRLLLALFGALSFLALLPASSFAAPAPPTHAATASAKAGKILYHSPTYLRQHPAPIGKTGVDELIYYDGPAMPTLHAYVIFWGTGFTTTYKNIVTNYFNDVGNTSFENVLNQYYDTSTHIHTSVTLAGTWSDTATPPTSNTCTDLNSTPQPSISDTSIENEVGHAITTEGWAADHTNGLYFVFTQPGDWIDAGGGTCSYSTFCAYHSYTGGFGTGEAYAAMPFPTPSGYEYACYEDGQPTPNGDTNGDAVINVTSHEQFEAQSDQYPAGPGNKPYTGWTDINNQEIGDKCAWTFPPSPYTTQLNNGHSYTMQLEWSNADSGCVNTFTTPAQWPSTGGVFRPSNGNLYLKLSNATGVADMTLTYGAPGDVPVVGDWTGKGYQSIGVYRNGQFLLRNSNTTGPADIVAAFGAAGDLPLVGDWTGKGYDSIGVYRPSTHQFLLRNSNTSGPPDIISTAFGAAGDLPVAGDWNHDGVDTVGLYRPSTGFFFLSDSNNFPAANHSARFGPLNGQPVIGDWDGDGTDTIGLSHNGHFFLRNTNSTGTADATYTLGAPTDLPIAGDWIAS